MQLMTAGPTKKMIIMRACQVARRQGNNLYGAQRSINVRKGAKKPKIQTRFLVSMLRQLIVLVQASRQRMHDKNIILLLDRLREFGFE